MAMHTFIDSTDKTLCVKLKITMATDKVCISIIYLKRAPTSVQVLKRMSKRCCVSLWLVLLGLLFGVFLVIISILMSTHFSQSLVSYGDTMAPLACASQDGIIDADAFDRHFDKIRYLGWCFISLSTLGLFVVLGHCTVLYLVYLVMYLSFCMGILSMIITHIFNRDKFSPTLTSNPH